MTQRNELFRTNNNNNLTTYPGTQTLDTISNTFISKTLPCTAAKMELKVWVEGIQRIVCGVTNETTCQVISIKISETVHQSREEQ